MFIVRKVEKPITNIPIRDNEMENDTLIKTDKIDQIDITAKQHLTTKYRY
jgi:hypothetical protein